MSPRDPKAVFAGCLLGGAVGDALGASVEFMSLAEIRARHGPQGITAYAEVYGRRGAITDDTQMTLFTAEGLIRAEAGRRRGYGGNPLRAIHRGYLRWLHTQASGSAHPDYDDALDGWLVRIPALHSRRSPGNTCLGALSLAEVGTIGHPLNDSKGCGGVMRVAPIGLFGDRPFEMACRACALTHGHPTGYLAGGSMAAIVADIASGASIHAAVHGCLQRHGPQLNDEVLRSLHAALELAQRPALRAEDLETLGGGWVAEEALAIGVCAALHARSFEHGVTLAVNHGGDSDSTGSIAGNLLGAAAGVHAIPPAWLQVLELREEITEVAHDLADARVGNPFDTTRYPPE